MLTKLVKNKVSFPELKNCEKLFSYNATSSTNHLNRHTQQFCPVMKIILCHKNVANQGKKYRTVTNVNVKSDILDKCIDFCASDLRPFETVSRYGFVNLFQAAINLSTTHGLVDAHSILPHPTTVSRHISDKAKTIREKYMPDILKALSNGELSFTTDMWTDDFRKHTCTAITVQYLKQWNIVNRVLFTCGFPDERKTGENIRK